MGKPIVEMRLEGDGYRRGLAHGRQVADLVRLAVAKWGDMRGADPVVIERLLRRLEENTRRVHPEGAEELRGIAEGSGVPYGEILQLNFCEALWNDTVGWCTNVAFLDAKPGPIVGKNSDLWEGDDAFHIVQRISPERGHATLRCGFAGYIGFAAGINEGGLAVSGSSVKVQRGSGHPAGVAAEVLTDLLLSRCANVQEAVQMAAGTALAAQGVNLMLVDAAGHAVVLEKSPSAQATIPGSGPAIYHTNHFRALGAAEERTDQADFVANSHDRIANLEQLTAAVPHTPEGMMALLRDHAPRGQICQHGHAELYSMVSHVLLPAQGRMLVAEGYPCQNEYVEFCL